jgi:predicted HTH transcriptional regulator
MENPRTPEELATQIEALVAGYVDEVRRFARQAVERGLAPGAGSTSKPSTPSKSSAKRKRTNNGRRSLAELEELSEALCALIHERPGESMATFAAELDVSIRGMRRPAKMLKRAGRIRSVGERQWTRYFPTVNGKAAHARG